MSLSRSSSDLELYKSSRSRQVARGESAMTSHRTGGRRSRSNDEKKSRRHGTEGEEFKWYKSQHGKKRRAIKRFVRRHIFRKQSKRLSRKLAKRGFIQPSAKPLSLIEITDTSDSSDSEAYPEFTEEEHLDVWMPKEDSTESFLRSRNTWCRLDGASFRCRIGPNYKKNRQKAPSGPSLYESLNLAMWDSCTKQPHIAQHMQLPSNTNSSGLPEYLVVNVMLPTYEPNSPWKRKLEDGPGVNLVLVARLAEWVKECVEEPPAVALWRKYVETQAKSNSQKFLERLKMITRLENSDELPLSKFEQALVDRYNGKPWMVRPQYEFHRGANYFEIDVDIHRFIYMVLKPVVPYLHKVATARVAVALIVQGESDQELPEQVLVAARINRLDITKSVSFEQVECRRPKPWDRGAKVRAPIWKRRQVQEPEPHPCPKAEENGQLETAKKKSGSRLVSISILTACIAILFAVAYLYIFGVETET